MTVTTFPSRWGGYNVTQVKLACPPEELRDSDGTVTQRVASMEMSDLSEAVRVTMQTIFRRADGTLHYACYQGQQFTTTKDKARALYRRLLTQDFQLEQPWLNDHNSM